MHIVSCTFNGLLCQLVGNVIAYAVLYVPLLFWTMQRDSLLAVGQRFGQRVNDPRARAAHGDSWPINSDESSRRDTEPLVATGESAA